MVWAKTRLVVWYHSQEKWDICPHREATNLLQRHVLSFPTAHFLKIWVPPGLVNVFLIFWILVLWSTCTSFWNLVGGCSAVRPLTTSEYWKKEPLLPFGSHIKSKGRSFISTKVHRSNQPRCCNQCVCVHQKSWGFRVERQRLILAGLSKHHKRWGYGFLIDSLVVPVNWSAMSSLGIDDWPPLTLWLTALILGKKVVKPTKDNERPQLNELLVICLWP